jgi:hypothetical protein
MLRRCGALDCPTPESAPFASAAKKAAPRCGALRSTHRFSLLTRRVRTRSGRIAGGIRRARRRRRRWQRGGRQRAARAVGLHVVLAGCARTNAAGAATRAGTCAARATSTTCASARTACATTRSGPCCATASGAAGTATTCAAARLREHRRRGKRQYRGNCHGGQHLRPLPHGETPSLLSLRSLKTGAAERLFRLRLRGDCRTRIGALPAI